jgi:hypothetical protein
MLIHSSIAEDTIGTALIRFARDRGLIRGEWIANRRSLPCAILSKGTPLWLPKLFFLAVDTAQKPYYFGSKNPHVSALFTTALLGLAPVRSTRATAAQPPEKH